MMKWKLRFGNFLFKYRSFTPIPLIIIVFVFFKPYIKLSSDNLLTVAGLIVMFLGEVIRLISVGFSFHGTSGRENFLRAESLNVSGIYSVVRNPLYIGNLLIYTGLLIVYSNLYALLIFDILLIVQYYFIILSEEEFLKEKYGIEYSKYCEKVNSIFPGFRDYIKPENKFNRLKVLFKENDSIFNALIIFGIILMYKGYIYSGRVLHGKSFSIYFGVLILFYIIIKIIKKKT